MREAKDETCGVCRIPGFERNNYFYAKSLTVRDLRAEQAYLNEKRWLLNRMVLGWGVVCGLDVCVSDGAIHVSPGLALDCCGRELLLCQTRCIKPDEIEQTCHPAGHGNHDPSRRWILCLEYRECPTEPVRVPTLGCDGDEHAFNRIREDVRLRLVPADEVKNPELHGSCCPLNHMKETGKPVSVHRYLCGCLKEGCPECDPCSCVALATVELRFELPPEEGKGERGHQQGCDGDHQPPPRPEIHVDPCGPRRLVYNNPLLHDLIHCYHGDLPHIVDVSWAPYHGLGYHEMSWDTFVGFLREGWSVSFDQAMDPATMNGCSFQIAALTPEFGTGYLLKRFLPVHLVAHSQDGRTFTFRAGDRWTRDELGGVSGLARGAQIEISMRGNLMRSLGGKPLAPDVEPLRGVFPTGNGSQGGEFVSCFHVAPRAERELPPEQGGGAGAPTDQGPWSGGAGGRSLAPRRRADDIFGQEERRWTR